MNITLLVSHFVVIYPPNNLSHQDHIHLVPAGGAGEGLQRSPLPWCLRPGDAGHEDRASWGQDTGRNPDNVENEYYLLWWRAAMWRCLFILLYFDSKIQITARLLVLFCVWCYSVFGIWVITAFCTFSFTMIDVLLFWTVPGSDYFRHEVAYKEKKQILTDLQNTLSFCSLAAKPSVHLFYWERFFHYLIVKRVG